MSKKIRRNARCIVSRAIQISFAIIAIQVTAVAAPGQIAAYSLDEGGGTTVTDASGNNHSGTLRDAPTWTDGKYNRGLVFDGSNDYVTFGQVASANAFTAFTVSTWVKFAASGGGARETHLVDKSRCDGYVNSGPWELGVAITAPGKAELVVYPENGAAHAGYLFSGASSTAVDDGNWHYVTGRYDGARLSIWVDGRQENSVDAPGLRLSSSTHSMELGGNCNGYAYPFRGTLDEVRLYARALSQAEIQADMTAAIGGVPPTPPADGTPPSSPTGLTLIHKTTTEASFSWAPSSDNVAVTGYRIFRNGVQVGTSGQTTYADNGLTANTAYVYTVTAFDAAGNNSSQSQPLSVTTAAAPSDGGGTSGASYSTHFNSTENPISEGGRWRRANNRWTNVQTVGGAAFGTNGVTDTYDDSYALLAGFGPDQTIEAVVYRDPNLQPVSTHEVELLLRFSDDPSNARGYECLFDLRGGFSIVRWNGPQGDFAHVQLVQSGYLGRQLVTGDVLKATIVGNTITMYVNGMLLAKGIDSAISHGQPGIGFFIRPPGSSKLLGLTSFTATSPTSQ
jgi:hypothetical protein